MQNERKILSRKLILEALKSSRSLFNQKPTDEALELYADLLSEEFEFKQVTWAITAHVKKGSAFFPSCGEIFSILSPKEETATDKAPQVAAEMLKLIRWYGKHDEATMLEKASPEARATFLRLGDTQDIRNSENTDTVRAQLERLARSVLSSEVVNEKNKQLEKIGVVIPMNRHEIRSMDYAGFLPEGDPA